MTKLKLLSKISIAALALAVPFTIPFMAPTPKTNSVSALNEDLQLVSIVNKDFDGISNSYAVGSVNGWAPKFGNTGGKMMIFDVAKDFANYHSDIYFLRSNQNPGRMGQDSKVLMINSANANPDSTAYSPKEIKDGYISNGISLDPNSYYEFNVSIKTSSFNNEDQEFGSIYISGLQDENGEEITSLKQEQITSRNWSTYYFFLSTGSKAQTITIDLWLGTQEHSSTGVAFFDSVNGVKVSQNAFVQDYEILSSQNKHIISSDQISDRNFVDTTGMNFDFENNSSSSSLVGWKIEPNMRDINGHAKILDMNRDNFEKETENCLPLTYPGTDFTINNTKSLVLYANDGYVTVTSQPLKIRQFAIYKITAYVKIVDREKGGFTMTLRETDTMKVKHGLSGYTPKSATLSSAITANGSSTSINNYNEVSMYVKGQDRYDSEIEILLNFGTKDEKAKGAAVVDNITVEYVGSAELTDTNSLKLTSLPSVDNAEIKNGSFNKATNIDQDFAMPAKPESFTLSDSGSKYEKKVGIINTYSEYFDSYYSVYGYEWAKDLANPGDSDPMLSDRNLANNILMLYNSNSDYQSITSSEFTVNKDSYKAVTFRFKTIEEGAKINVKLLDSEGCILMNDLSLASTSWKTYRCVIFGGETDCTMSLVIEFGNSASPAIGHAFIDDIKVENTDGFDESTRVDLSNLRIELDPNGEISNNISSSTAFTGSHDSGNASDSDGGIVLGKGNDTYKYRDSNGEEHSIDDGSLEGNVLVLFTKNTATYTLTSRFTLSLSNDEDNYYALSFRLLTSFPGYHGEHMHDDKDVPFGLNVGLEGFKMIENLQSNDGWQEYTIIFNSDSAKDAKLKFTLASDCLVSAGYVYITDINWAPSNADAFERADGEKVFASTVSTDDNNDDNNNDDNNTSPSTNGGISDTLWLLIPSIIMAVAVIVAVVGFSIRHIKVKKVERAKKEEYDRADTLHENAITNEAKQIQKAELDAIDKDIEDLQKQIQTLEEENKAITQKSRTEGKVTKEIERQFKSFAQKRGKIQKLIDEYNEHRALIASPDYLLTVEKRVRAQKKNSEDKK